MSADFSIAELNIKQIKTLLSQAEPSERAALLAQLAAAPRSGVQKLIARTQKQMLKEEQLHAHF